MKAHTFKDLVQMTMTGDEVFYLAEDVGSLIIRKNLLLNEKDARIAELEEFIKVLLPSWPDGEHYPTEMSLLQMKQERIAELEKALREIVEFKPGTFWGLEDEIKIHQTAKKALGL